MFKKYFFLGFFWFTALVVHAQDTTYFVNGSISTITTSWKQGRQQVFLYNLEGLNTSVFTQVRSVYSVKISFLYAKNGSVSELVETIHPGGSPCTQKVTYYFNSMNEPLRKEIEPQFSTLCYCEPATWFWRKKKRIWVKQEQVYCSPINP